MQATKENLQKQIQNISYQCGRQKSWTSLLNVVVMNALPVHMGLLPVAEPAHPPIALLHPECVSIVAQSQSEVLSELGTRKKSVLLQSPSRRVDHSLPSCWRPTPKCPLYLPVIPLMNTTSKKLWPSYRLMIMKNSHIYLSKIYSIAVFESYVTDTPLLIKELKSIHWSLHWIASSFINLSPLCLSKAGEGSPPPTIGV